ncbi:MAG: tetratricopeptide repeat protein [Candidatus Bathyarchaeia archaeon]
MTSLERGRIPSPRPIAVKEIRLIDRVEEMSILKEAVDRIVQNEGGLVFLHGEAGIGKTRLTRELTAYAHLHGFQVLYGRCPALFRMDGVPPYVLWSEVIKDYLETCSPEHLYKVIGFYPAEVAKLVPELGQKLGTIPQSFPISPQQEQNRLFEAVSQFMTNISREAPLLIVLDDLQWTDPSSLLLLHYLARGLYRVPLLLLGAYRSTDIDPKHALTSVLTELNRERLLRSVQLKRMNFEDVSEMIKSILEQEDAPPDFCKLIYEKTGGNPFFVEEVVKSLKEEGVIRREENKWKFKEVSEIQFPETVKSVIKTRIDRLDEECQNVLTQASFIGNDFTIEAMCAVTGIEEDKLLELMDRMFKTGLIKERVTRGQGICSFADILVRDVVYEEVSPLKRKKLHGVVGSALERVYAQKVDEHLGELASHFLEAGEQDKALDYFLKAGERATKIYAHDEAASNLQSALKLLEEKEGAISEKGHVLEKLGEIKRLVGEHDACMKYWNDGLLLWEQTREKENAARLHRKIAHVLWEGMGETEKAIEHQDKALKILENEPESAELARLYDDMAHMYWRIGNTESGRSWAERALEFAKKLNDYEIIASSCLSLGTIFNLIGDNKKAVEFEQMALEIALDNECVETAIRAYNNLALALPPEETEKAVQYYEKGYDLAKKTGDIGNVAWLGTSLAEMCLGAGNMSKAFSLAEESVALDRKAGNLNHLSMSLDALGALYMALGEWDKGEKCFKEALNIAQGLKDYQAISYSYSSLAFFYYDKGEYAKAKEVAEKGYEAIKKTGDRIVQMWYLYWITDMDIELGEIEKAQSQTDDLYKFGLEMKTSNRLFIAYANRLKGKLLRAQKKWEESIEYFEKSLQDFEAFDARRWYMYDYAKRVLCEYARTYMDRDQEGDRQKADNLLSQALEIFQKIGAKKDIESTESKIIHAETGHEATAKAESTAMPSVAPRLVPTGYSDLDDLLYGGIPEKYAVVLTSPPCDEKDSLVNSFLETGAKRSEVTFYVTIEAGAAKTLAEEFPSNFYLFLCNPQADSIINNAPNVFKLKGVENLTDISIALTSAIRALDALQKGPRRICISLISDVLLQHHAVQTRRWLTALIAELRSKGFTTLGVMDPQMHPPEDLHATLGLFEGEISIYDKETEKGTVKYLKIKKMSNHKHLEKELQLKKTN